MKKALILLSAIFVIVLPSCAEKNKNITQNYFAPAGNIQNGGYVIKYNDDYFYANQDDNDHLYFKKMPENTDEKFAGGHYYYEMNLNNDTIYYISGSPGNVWCVSIDGSRRCIVNQHVGNLLIYKDNMYYRLSEDDDWGKLYKADLNGKNKKLLAQKVKNFCISDNVIYYMDIHDKNTLCSMNTDGTDINVINNSYANNILVQNNKLIYSDYNRNDNLYVYDLDSRTEKCITEDKCWNLNCNANWIFYRNQNDNGSLYCINFDGSVKKKLVDVSVADIVIVDDYICYRNIQNSNRLEYIKFTG